MQCHHRKTSHLKRKINSSHIHRTEIFHRFCWCFAHFSPLQFPLNDIDSNQLNVKYFFLLINVSFIASPAICILSNALFSRIHVHFRFRRIWSSSSCFFTAYCSPLCVNCCTMADIINTNCRIPSSYSLTDYCFDWIDGMDGCL